MKPPRASRYTGVSGGSPFCSFHVFFARFISFRFWTGVISGFFRFFSLRGRRERREKRKKEREQRRRRG